MIKSLNLENFGRFHKKIFNFSPVTIFYGPNEAGKTSLFDAIMDVITQPKASTRPGKILTERYGSDRKASADFEEKRIVISPEDFLNIFAVRSGYIDLDIDKNSQWMNKVKATLFSGGIDTQSLLNELEHVMESKAKYALKWEEKNLEDSLAEIKSEKKKYITQKDNCIAEEKLIKVKEQNMLNAALEINKLKAEEKELENFLYQQNRIKEEKHLKNILSVLGEAARKKDESEKYSRFNQDVLNEIQKTETELAQVKSELGTIIALEEDVLIQLGSKTREKSLLEEKKNRLDTHRILSESLKEILVPKDKLISLKTERIYKKHFLAIGAVILTAGVVTFFLSSFNIVFPTAALALAVLFFALSREKKISHDISGLEEAVSAGCRRWKMETGEECLENYDSIMDVLNSAGEKARAAAAELDHIIRHRAELEEKAESLLLQKNNAGNKTDAVHRRLRQLLDDAGTADISEYSAQLERKKQIMAQYSQLNSKIKSHEAEYNSSGREELFDTVSRKLKDLSLSITENEVSEAETRKLENKLMTVKNKLEHLREINIENTSNFSKELGIIRGQVKGLPEKIYECEVNEQKTELRLSEIKKELRAAKIAHELYTSLSDDSEQMLEQLSDEIAKTFKTITNEDRAVQMENYSEKDIEVFDAGGEKRYVQMLSTGTKDAFLLAARLTLAHKSMDPSSSAILVLDEPFLALDRERSYNALAMLKTFRENSSSQIVLLTKDSELKDQAKTVFGEELCIHDLKSSLSIQQPG